MYLCGCNTLCIAWARWSTCEDAVEKNVAANISQKFILHGSVLIVVVFSSQATGFSANGDQWFGGWSFWKIGTRWCTLAIQGANVFFGGVVHDSYEPWSCQGNGDHHRESSIENLQVESWPDPDAWLQMGLPKAPKEIQTTNRIGCLFLLHSTKQFGYSSCVFLSNWYCIWGHQSLIFMNVFSTAQNPGEKKMPSIDGLSSNHGVQWCQPPFLRYLADAFWN